MKILFLGPRKENFRCKFSYITLTKFFGFLILRTRNFKKHRKISLLHQIWVSKLNKINLRCEVLYFDLTNNFRFSNMLDPKISKTTENQFFHKNRVFRHEVSEFQTQIFIYRPFFSGLFEIFGSAILQNRKIW